MAEAGLRPCRSHLVLFYQSLWGNQLAWPHGEELRAAAHSQHQLASPVQGSNLQVTTALADKNSSELRPEPLS